ncbi:hypothetical protein [Paenibacillus kobensis]|uniref:hypothetical protein n=1 Tax=Paenibacillus kobensis TaxID=59841 RepID=UPI000FDA731B|nr:hypothetical protein [Paenibacillus kobensis]
MTFAKYEGDWINTIYLRILCLDHRIERSINREDGSIFRETRHSYPEGTTALTYANYYRADGYKEVVDLAEFEAEIAAQEGQEQLVAEHIEEIERGTAA